eukprot:gene2764-1970_t
MQAPDKGDHQGNREIDWLGIKYADLALMHEGDLSPEKVAKDGGKHCEMGGSASTWTGKNCRRVIFEGCVAWMKTGRCKACGVANWPVEWLQELVEQNVTLPSVVQTKFHPHQSLATPAIAKLKAFCDQGRACIISPGRGRGRFNLEHGIVFNGYSPLGRADWTEFDAAVGTPTLLKEPAVIDIAQRAGRSAAQVLLRWHVQGRGDARPLAGRHARGGAA